MNEQIDEINAKDEEARRKGRVRRRHTLWPAREVPLVTGRDIALVLGLPGLTAYAWTIPRRQWPAMCRWLAPKIIRLRLADPELLASYIAKAFGDERPDQSPDEILLELVSEEILAMFEMLRSHRPGRWDARITISGREHLEAARKSGRGVIFWLGPYAHTDIIPKAALAREGFGLAHLSRSSHGLSASRFGMKVLNPIPVAAENRFLARRVIFNPDNPGPVLKGLARTLKAGEPVTIRAARPPRTSQPLHTDFLGNKLRVAPGPAFLARQTGAALLPVFSWRQPDMSYVVDICANLNSEHGTPRQQSMQEMAEAFANAMEPGVRANPGQWSGWYLY